MPQSAPAVVREAWKVSAFRLSTPSNKLAGPPKELVAFIRLKFAALKLVTLVTKFVLVTLF